MPPATPVDPSASLLYRCMLVSCPHAPSAPSFPDSIAGGTTARPPADHIQGPDGEDRLRLFPTPVSLTACQGASSGSCEKPVSGTENVRRFEGAADPGRHCTPGPGTSCSGSAVQLLAEGGPLRECLLGREMESWQPLFSVLRRPFHWISAPGCPALPVALSSYSKQRRRSDRQRLQASARPEPRFDKAIRGVGHERPLGAAA